MRGSRTATAAITLAAAFGLGIAASFAGTAQAEPDTPASWHVVERVHAGPDGQFTAVTAAGQNGGWAFTGVAGPTAYERTGSTWTRAQFPKESGQVVTAAATSPDNVWAFTDGIAGSDVLRFNGSTWTVMRTFKRQVGGAVVLGASNVWVFGVPYIPGAYLGAWHYNGHTWTQVRGGSGLIGGSALSASDIWAFGGRSVAHWNGSAWTRTSVAGLLPPSNPLNAPSVTGIYAQSATSVYAVGSGNQQDEGGPMVLLHYNGKTWTKVAQANDGSGTSPIQQIASDGHGGLWIPAPGYAGQKSYLLHYSGGTLAPVTLPGTSRTITIESIALIPGGSNVLAGGFTHAASSDGANVVSVLLQYGS